MNPLSRAAALAAATTCVGMLYVPAASADESPIHTLGSPAELTNGDVVQAWTVKDLKPSADVIPYPVAGTLWQATALDTAVQGNVQPVIPNFSARARSGQTYRVLFGVATPQGVNPAVLSPGQQSTGLIYFDVTGDAPDSVVYNSGGPDLAVWVAPPPPPRSTTSGTASTPNSASLPAAPAAALPPTATPAAPVALAPVSAGTPVVPGSPAVPATAPSSTGPAPTTGAPGVPPPASAGTPLPNATGTPTPDAGSTPAAVTPPPVAPPAASAGTPASPTAATPALAPTTTIAPPP